MKSFLEYPFLDQPVVWILGGMAMMAIMLYLAQSVLVLVGGTALGLYMYQRYRQKPDLWTNMFQEKVVNTLLPKVSLKESMMNLQTPLQKRWSDQMGSLLDT
jgi:hypothetical protein